MSVSTLSEYLFFGTDCTSGQEAMGELNTADAAREGGLHIIALECSLHIQVLLHSLTLPHMP